MPRERVPIPRRKRDTKLTARLEESSDSAAASEYLVVTMNVENAKSEIIEIDTKLSGANSAKEASNLLLQKAYLYGMLCQFNDARTALNLAVRQSPTDPEIRFQYDFIDATLHDQEERPDKAAPKLGDLLQKYREQLKSLQFRSFYENIQLRRGLDFASLRKFEDAIPLLVESLSFDITWEERSAVLSNLGYSYCKVEDWYSAKNYLTQACEFGLTKAWEGYVHFELGVTNAHLNLFAESKQEFQLCEQHATEFNLPLPMIYRWLAGLCKRLGQQEEEKHYRMLARPS